MTTTNNTPGRTPHNEIVAALACDYAAYRAAKDAHRRLEAGQSVDNLTLEGCRANLNGLGAAIGAKLELLPGDWQITRIDYSERNGGYFVEGINHSSISEMDRRFAWHVSELGPRFYTTDTTEITDRAAELLARDA